MFLFACGHSSQFIPVLEELSQFASLSEKMEISAQDIHTIQEDSFFGDIAVLHTKGRTAIQMGMSDSMDFIETAQLHNPAIQVTLFE